jgi:secreted trypsin-like serine protease
VKLPPRKLQNETFIGSTVRVSGWGKYGDNTGTSQVLRFVDLTVRELNVCSSVFGTTVVRESNVCTTGEANKSSCGGDSGGPLTINLGSEKYQIGVVSYGT